MKAVAVAAVAVASMMSVGCDVPSSDSARTSSSASPAESASPTPAGREARREAARVRMEERLIPIEEAIARLQPHLDVRVVLPRARLAGLPNLKGWGADPKYLDWGRAFGVRHGSLQLVKEGKILIVSFGLVSFDGCGGTDHAISTQVSGQPAFLSVSREGLWSQIVWPMGVGDTTASHGLAGNFEGWQLLRLAESMEERGISRSTLTQSC